VQQLAEQLFRADIAASAVPQTPKASSLARTSSGSGDHDHDSIGNVPADVPGKLIRMVQERRRCAAT
jgi:hypothetical protein